MEKDISDRVKIVGNSRQVGFRSETVLFFHSEGKLNYAINFQRKDRFGRAFFEMRISFTL